MKLWHSHLLREKVDQSSLLVQGNRACALGVLDAGYASSPATPSPPSPRSWKPWLVGCPGRAGCSYNRVLDDEKIRSISVAEAARLKPTELGDKIVTGVLLYETGGPEFQRFYATIIEQAQAEVAEQATQEGAE
jgi:hypothetical protein